jgi:hypothetical protein
MGDLSLQEQEIFHIQTAETSEDLYFVSSENMPVVQGVVASYRNIGPASHKVTQFAIRTH